MRYYSISDSEGMDNVVENYNDILIHLETTLAEAEVGTMITVEVVEMTKEEFENLPEF